MADPTGRTALGDPATRGRLAIKDKAVQSIAAQAAHEVAGVTRGRGAGWNPLTSSAPARVDVSRVDDRLDVVVHLSVAWPESLSHTASAAQHTVQERLTTLTGLTVTRVDVLVDTVPTSYAEPERRVR